MKAPVSRFAFSGSNAMATLVRIVLGAVFLYSGATKVADPTAFAAIVTNYRMLPPPLVWGTAVILPWIEMLCGLALVAGRLQKGAAFMVCLMMAVFVGTILYNGYRGLNVACGCFSLTARTPSNLWFNLLRNLTILAAAAWILVRPTDAAPSKNR